jgi:uncharacterized membrane protein YjgN (DUF898 family)
MNPYPDPQAAAQPGLQQHWQAPAPQYREVPFRFTGNASEYFRIWIVNTLLSIVTLGIYSAWAKVRRKQYFYRHTWLDGSSFEYLAEPLKVLKGRLLIGAILIALGASQHYSPVLYLSLLGALLLASPWLLVKALAFNARNSAYRNVRFAFAGRTGEAYGAYFAFMLVYIFTCGFGYPYAQWRLTLFALTRHYFGDLAFRWTAKVADYYVTYLLAFLIVLPAYAGLIAWAVITAMNKNGAGTPGPAAPPDLKLLVPLLAVLYTYLLIPAAFLRARLSNLMFGGLGLEHHRFAANQRPRDLIVIYATNALAIVFSLGLMIPWAQIRLARYRAEHLTLLAAGDLQALALGLDGGRTAVGDAATDLGDLDFDLGL